MEHRLHQWNGIPIHSLNARDDDSEYQPGAIDTLDAVAEFVLPITLVNEEPRFSVTTPLNVISAEANGSS